MTSWIYSDRGWSYLEITDAMRREALRIRSAGRVPAGSVNGLIMSAAEDCLCDKETSLDDVSLEGLRRWNMDMDIANQYDTFSGLPVYYGGDMYDSEVMELLVYKRCRPEDGEARSVDTVDMVPMCQTVSCVMRIGPDESSDMSGMDTVVVNGSDMEDFISGRSCRTRRIVLFPM